MQTQDTRFKGDVQTYATDYNTADYRIEYACGVGNKSGKLVFMGLLKSNSKRDAIIQTGLAFTTVQEAILTLVLTMTQAQKNLNNFYAKQLDDYNTEYGD